MLGRARRFHWLSWLILGVPLVALVVCAPAQPAAPAAKAPEPAARSATAPAAAAQSGGTSAAAAPTQPAAPAAPESIVVSTPAKTLVYLPVYIAQAYGYAAEEGLDLSVQPMQGNLTIVGMETGQVDYTMATGSAFRAAIQGVPVKVIAVLHDKLGWYLTAQPDITSIEQLAGKAVGVTTPSATDALSIRAVARKRGVDPSTITMVAVGPTNLLQSLEAGAVAASNLSVPLNTMARDRGFNWLTFVGDEVEGSFAGLATTERKIREQPEQVKRLFRATLKGIEFLQQRRPDVEAYMVREWDVPERLAASTYDVFMRTINPRGIASASVLEADAAFAAEELGIERASFQPSALVDYRLLEEVLRETGRR